jgi:hypothetical protein
MVESKAVTPLSSALEGGIARMYTLGGLGLTFVFVGALFLLASALIGRGPTSYTLAAVGLVLILAVLTLFYLREIRPIRDAQRAVTANADLVDTVQETALEMTGLARDLQALAFKYASEIGSLVVAFQGWARERGDHPLVKALPGADRWVETLVDNEYTMRAGDLSKAIVRTTESAEQVISDVETALANSDAKALKRYVARIQDLDASVKGVLAGPSV